LKQFAGKQRPVVWHQTGKTTYDTTLSLYQQEQLDIDGKNIKVTAFIEDMAAAYQWADVVLCRAGAITLAEITCVGLPSVLVPLPNAIDNHQYKNAESLSSQQAAMLIPQNELSADKLMMTLVALSTDRARLQRMAQQAKKIAEPKAAQRVADICLDVSAKKSGGAHG